MNSKIFISKILSKVELVITKIKIIIAVLILLAFITWVVGIYFSQLPLPLNAEFYKTAASVSSINEQTREALGQMGDFFGGMLNPILAFASFIALLYTIRLQSRELEISSKELKKATEAHVESSQSLKKQQELIEKQNFENTFFKMLDNITQLSSELEKTNRMEIIDLLENDTQFSGAIINGKVEYDNKESWRYMKEQLLERIPRIEQIAKSVEIALRFLATNSTEDLKKDTFIKDSHRLYIELTANAIGVTILKALVIYCSSMDTPEKLCRLVEYCSFFEPLKLNYEDNLNNKSILKLAQSGISPRAFTHVMTSTM